MSMSLRLAGRVAVVTGAGAGLGRAYALALAARGARVVVNDLGTSVTGQGSERGPADKVVEEIVAAGGQAVANYDSVEHGDRIVAAAASAFGGVDIVVNNAGILRDRTFARMSDEDWDKIFAVHVRGAYAVTKAAWPHMRKAGYGRIVFVSSASGLYGNIGQANYAAAKMALVGFSNTLAREGAAHNIKSNVIAPLGGSRMTATVLPESVLSELSLEGPAALVTLLASDACPTTGAVLEVGGRWVAGVRWQRAQGAVLPERTPEALLERWADVETFDAQATAPTGLQDSMQQALGAQPGMRTARTAYTARDVSLYALGVGATELPLVYERHARFAPLSSFGTTLAYASLSRVLHDGFPGLPSFDPARVVHGEHELLLHRPLPPQATLVTRTRLRSVQPKRSGVVVELVADSEDPTTQSLVCTNVMRLFVRGLTLPEGAAASAGADAAPPAMPTGAPDASLTLPTAEWQALLFRLSGDYNPLHADPAVAARVGYERPILHGLCSLGVATRALTAALADAEPQRITGLRVRFTAPVLPGEALTVDMWRLGADTAAFRVRVGSRVVLDHGQATIAAGTAGPAARL